MSLTWNVLADGTTTKFIDAKVDKQFNLIALSIWLFIGDIGSVTGANTWISFQPMLCSGKLGAHHWPHYCIPES